MNVTSFDLTSLTLLASLLTLGELETWRQMVAASVHRRWKRHVLRWLLAALVGICLFANLHPHKALASPCGESPYQPNTGALLVSPTHALSNIHSSSAHLDCDRGNACVSALPTGLSARVSFADYNKRASDKFVAFFLAALSILERQTALEPHVVPFSTTPPTSSLAASLILLPSVVLTI